MAHKMALSDFYEEVDPALVANQQDNKFDHKIGPDYRVTRQVEANISLSSILGVPLVCLGSS